MLQYINEKFHSRPLWEAWAFACGAHNAINHIRKYTGEPYTNHLIEVASLVSHCEDATEEMVAAALLHDVIEDTGVTTQVLSECFRSTVVNYVDWLTDSSTPEDGNRETRKRIDRERLARAPSEVQTIKLADLIANTKSIVAHDPHFAKVYLAEKQLLLEVLTYGDRGLHEEASRLCAEGLAHLENLRLEKALENTYGR